MGECDNFQALPPQIELTVDFDLILRDEFSEIQCIIWVKKEEAWEEFKRSERKNDQENPRWETRFVLDYKFEERQLLKFEVIDVGGGGIDIDIICVLLIPSLSYANAM